MKQLLVFVSLLGVSLAQFGSNPSNPFQSQFSQFTTTPPTTTTTTQGPRLLSLPDAQLCASRPKQWQHNKRNYYFSWDQDASLGLFDPEGKGQRKVDWLEARNQCRKRCMDAVSMENESETLMVESFMRNRNITYIWTSGRLCDFKGCETRTDLIPLNVLGWFWSNTNTKMAATNAIPQGWNHQPWSQTGHTKVPQPDNAEFDINQTPESCMAVLNNIYQDGIKWHDIACYHKKPYICEDSQLLLEYVEATVPGIRL